MESIGHAVVELEPYVARAINVGQHILVIKASAHFSICDGFNGLLATDKPTTAIDARYSISCMSNLVYYSLFTIDHNLTTQMKDIATTVVH